MAEHEMSEGFSTKKVVAGAALGVAVPAAVAVAKRLVGGNGTDDGDGGGDAREHDDGAQDEPMSRERKHATRARSKAKSTSSRTKRTGTTSSSTTNRTKNRTREQLYKQATRLKIEGRSSMNKAQLERAVDRAKQKTKAR